MPRCGVLAPTKDIPHASNAHAVSNGQIFMSDSLTPVTQVFSRTFRRTLRIPLQGMNTPPLSPFWSMGRRIPLLTHISQEASDE